MSRQTPWLAYGLAVINATIIGLSFMFAKVAVTTEVVPGRVVSAFDTLAFRFLIGLTAFGIFMRMTGVRLHESPPKQELPESSCREKKSWWSLLPIVLFYPIGFFTFQAFGLRSVPSSEAGILTASTPAMTAILAALVIRERTNLKQFACIFLSIGGVIYISWKQGASLELSNFMGIVLILLSCLSSAGYTIYNRILIRRFTPSEITFVLMLFGTLCFWSLSIIEHTVLGNFSELLIPLRNPRFVLSIFYLGIFASLGTTILSSLILKRISPSQLVVFFNLSTVVAILAGFLFLGEKIYFYHLAGAVVIVMGVIGTNFFEDSDSGEIGKPDTPKA